MIAADIFRQGPELWHLQAETSIRIDAVAGHAGEAGGIRRRPHALQDSINGQVHDGKCSGSAGGDGFFREGQFQFQAVGTFQEQLRQVDLRHHPFHVFHPGSFQTFHDLAITRAAKGDMINPAGAVGNFCLLNQMQDRLTARVNPGAGELERRAITNPQAQDIYIEFCRSRSMAPVPCRAQWCVCYDRDQDR